MDFWWRCFTWPTSFTSILLTKCVHTVLIDFVYNKSNMHLQYHLTWLCYFYNHAVLKVPVFGQVAIRAHNKTIRLLAAMAALRLLTASLQFYPWSWTECNNYNNRSLSPAFPTVFVRIYKWLIIRRFITLLESCYQWMIGVVLHE